MSAPDSTEVFSGRELILLSDASKMLAEARTFEDVRKIRNLAEAARAYARAHHLGLDAQNKAGIVAVEATIREGEILKQMDVNGERAGVGKPNTSISEGLPTLADLGISYKESADAQVMAEQSEAVLEWVVKAKEVTPRRAARVARDEKAKRYRQETPPPTLPASCDFREGDFREVLADIPDASIDLILTDPPYPKEYLLLWSDLAMFAKRVLKQNGMLVAMSGQAHLPEVMARLGEHLPYRWTIAYLMTGAANVVHARKVNTMWKPVVVYGASDRRIHDVARSDGEDKKHHGWGQSESGMADLLRLVANTGIKVCDPFVGGGTVALVALAAGCQFIGAEIDSLTYRKAIDRISA